MVWLAGRPSLSLSLSHTHTSNTLTPSQGPAAATDDGEEAEPCCPYIVLASWLDESLCVNEALYPPPPDLFLGLPPLDQQPMGSIPAMGCEAQR